MSMRSYIDEINKFVMDLKFSGAEINEIDTNVYILMSLSEVDRCISIYKRFKKMKRTF